MKYGQNLIKLSVPEWACYNIDYDEVKAVIKHNTTPGYGKAVSIPGTGNGVEQDFENSLLALLSQEHERVNLFIKSKNGEIDRRLDYCDQQLARLQRRSHHAYAQIPPKLLQRYARIEDDVLRTGEEINRLSRFTNAQKLACRKLLKKYKKWTGSETLGQRFVSQHIDRGESFWNLNIGPLLNRYGDILHSVRAAFAKVSHKDHTREQSTTTVDGVRVRNPISDIRKALEDGSDVDFDVALEATPLGRLGQRAVFWVHPENIIELQVLLLQYMRLLVPRGKRGSSCVSPARPSTSHSLDTSDNVSHIPKEDETGFIVLDSQQRFFSDNKRLTTGDSEQIKRPSHQQISSIAHARWTTEGLAVVAITDDLDPSECVLSSGRAAKVKLKNLPAFLNLSRGYSRKSSTTSLEDNKSTATPESIEQVRLRLSTIDGLDCLAGVSSKRLRYSGLNDAASSAAWAVLDTDISIKKTMLDDLTYPDWLAACRNDSLTFPFAVLEIRYEGGAGQELVEMLDHSHLVERAHGFSLDVHAVWACSESGTTNEPFWLPKLSSDIRKVPGPAAEKSKSKGSSVSSKASTRVAPSSFTLVASGVEPHDTASTSNRDEISATFPSVDHGISKAFEGRRERRQELRKQRENNRKSSTYPRNKYWSEYDHPEEEDEDKYVIYINPDESTPFPFEETITKLARKVKALFSSEHRNGKTLADHDQQQDQQTLLQDPTADESSDDDASSNEATTDKPLRWTRKNRHRSNHYGTLQPPSPQSPQPLPPAFTTNNPDLENLSPADLARERQKTIYAASSLLGAALLALASLAVELSTTRKRRRRAVNAGIEFGVAVSFLLALIGVAYAAVSRSSRGRDAMPAWPLLLGVAGVFAAVCVVNALIVGSTVTVTLA